MFSFDIEQKLCTILVHLTVDKENIEDNHCMILAVELLLIVLYK